MDVVAIVIPRPSVLEGDNFTATAYFRDRATSTADAPDTIHFRIDCLTNRSVVQDWFELTAGESVAIALASAYNALIVPTRASERKQLTVVGNKDGTFQATAQIAWTVKNRNLQT